MGYRSHAGRDYSLELTTRLFMPFFSDAPATPLPVSVPVFRYLQCPRCNVAPVGLVVGGVPGLQPRGAEVLLRLEVDAVAAVGLDTRVVLPLRAWCMIVYIIDYRPEHQQYFLRTCRANALSDFILSDSVIS